MSLRLPLLLAVLLVSSSARADDLVADLDGDGVPELSWTWRDGGSGYREDDACVLDGGSGVVWCGVLSETAYSPFAGVLVSRDGVPQSLGEARRSPLGALVIPVACADPDPASPAQGAMWRMAGQNPVGGVMDLPPLRVPGPPVAQERVCMSPGEAVTLAGVFSWDASGTMTVDRATADGWAIAWLFAAPPTEELLAGPLVFFRSHAAVAVWHRDADVHGWIVNLADGSEEGFKIDRWQRVSGFRQDGESVSMKVHRSGAARRLVVDTRTWAPGR